MEYESVIMELIVNGGDARSKALEAVMAAGEGKFDKADDLMQECNDALLRAHNSQTELLQKEAAGESDEPVTLLMVHAQDHLMNAITIKDLAVQMIQMYREIYALKKDKKGGVEND